MAFVFLVVSGARNLWACSVTVVISVVIDFSAFGVFGNLKFPEKIRCSSRLWPKLSILATRSLSGSAESCMCSIQRVGLHIGTCASWRNCREVEFAFLFPELAAFGCKFSLPTQLVAHQIYLLKLSCRWEVGN